MQTPFYTSVDESQKPNEQKKPDTDEYMLDNCIYRSSRTNKADACDSHENSSYFRERDADAHWGTGNVCSLLCVVVTCVYTYMEVI